MGERQPPKLGAAAPTLSREVALSTHVDARWYAVYTCANHERRVAEHFRIRSIEHFLPQYESVRKWKDRKVRLALPLFRGYIFVHLALPNRLRVLEVPGVVRLIGFDGQPVAVPDEDLNRVRDFLNRGHRAEPHPYLKDLRAGRRVRAKSGPLAGMNGIVVRKKNSHRFVISFELIQRAMAVEVADGDLEPV